MNENLNHNWYAVITAEVLLSEKLSSTQKLLIALITNLSNEKGYCFASNEYLGKCMNVSAGTISNNLTQLVDEGWLMRELVYSEKQEVIGRKLMFKERVEVFTNSCTPPAEHENVDTPSTENSTPIHENQHTPIHENMKENNKVSNNKFDKVNVVVDGAREHIIKDLFEKPHTKLSMAEFRDQIHHFKGKYDEELLKNFYNRWRQKDDRGVMRFQKETYWDTESRLENWYKVEQEIQLREQQKNQNNNGKNNRASNGSNVNGAAAKSKQGVSEARIEAAKQWGRGNVAAGGSGTKDSNAG